MIRDIDEIKEKAKQEARVKLKRRKAIHYDDSNVVVINSYEGQNEEEVTKKIEEEEKKITQPKEKK